MNTKQRLEGIDVLRGLAVLFVVIHHINLRFRLNKFEVSHLVPEPIARVLFWSGYYSVIVFFVISGFLITSLSLRRWGSLERIHIKEFYGLRISRIAPCLLALLAVSSLLHLAAIPAFTINPERASLGRSLLAALTFHLNWLEGMRGYLPGTWDVLWSLSIEETFYLLFPLVCVCLRSERMVLVVLMALILIGPFNRVSLAGQAPWDDYAYLSCMDGIAFGCLAAWVSARLRPAKTLLRIGLTLGLATTLLIEVFRQQTFDWGLTTIGLNVTLLEFGIALVLLALANDVGNSALSKGTAVLQAIGRRSYEIYLSHMFVVLGLMQLFKALQPSKATIPIWYGIMLLVSIGLGHAISYWYSDPANRLGREKFASLVAQHSVASS